MSKKYTYIGWDFNGTIIDDILVGIKSMNCLLERRGIPVIESIEKYREIFGFPVAEYYKRAGFDLEKESFADVAIEWIDEYNKRYNEAKVRRGAIETIRYFESIGLKQYIISATEINMLKGQLDGLSITNVFEGIYGLSDIHAKTKKGIMKAWADTVDKENACFIGDTTHDYKTANMAGVSTILISGGHQSDDILKSVSDGEKCIFTQSFDDIKSIVLGESVLCR